MDILKKIALLGLLAFMGAITGCLNPTPVKTESAISSELTFQVITPDRGIENGDKINSVSQLMSYLGVTSYDTHYRNNYKYKSSLKWKWSDNNFTASRLVCLKNENRCNRFQTQQIDISGDLHFEKQKSKVILTVVPLHRSKATTASYDINFDATHIKSQFKKARFSWQFEIDSQYNSDAIYANFARLAKKEVFRSGGQKDPITGKIFKERFWINVGDMKIPVTVETYPYRNGSKAIIYAQLKPVENKNTFDYLTISRDLKKKVKSIINS